MMKSTLAVLTIAGSAVAAAAPAQADGPYGWRARQTPVADGNRLVNRFAPPKGFVRVPVPPDSFGRWLRYLPLKPEGTPVRLHDGRLKPNQSVHAAVVDIDTGRRDLQQCADAVIRLRAEYLHARQRYGAIRFHFTSGDLARFDRWAAGWRPRIRGNRVRWVRGRPSGSGRASFRRYLRTVFTYAGTISVRREMVRIPIAALAPGDVFVEAGSPGHAVLVVDVVRNPKTGHKAFMLLQSYMPAQDMHILRNPRTGSVWYTPDFGAELATPEWRFRASDLRRFKDDGS